MEKLGIIIYDTTIPELLRCTPKKGRGVVKLYFHKLFY